jgi:RNA polymerase sigma-70 factor (ECF subfamily)
MPGANPTETPAADQWFKTTHWSVVLAVRNNDPVHAQAALAKLCHVYWYPLYYYVRRRGYSSPDAQDLTQEFFARCLEKDYLLAAERERGKFRSFLLLALKRFLSNEWDKARCQKRGGGLEILSLDAETTESRYVAEPADEMTPEKAFERRWAMAVLEQVLNRLEADFSEAGKSELFNELKIFLSGEKSERPSSEIALRLGMTEVALRGAVYRLRQQYRQLLRKTIADTVDGPEAIDDEIRQLLAALS